MILSLKETVNNEGSWFILQCDFNGHSVAPLVVAGAFLITDFCLAVTSWGLCPHHPSSTEQNYFTLSLDKYQYTQFLSIGRQYGSLFVLIAFIVVHIVVYQYKVCIVTYQKYVNSVLGLKISHESESHGWIIFEYFEPDS